MWIQTGGGDRTRRYSQRAPGDGQLRREASLPITPERKPGRRRGGDEHRRWGAALRCRGGRSGQPVTPTPIPPPVQGASRPDRADLDRRGAAHRDPRVPHRRRSFGWISAAVSRSPRAPPIRSPSEGTCASTRGATGIACDRGRDRATVRAAPSVGAGRRGIVEPSRSALAIHRDAGSGTLHAVTAPLLPDHATGIGLYATGGRAGLLAALKASTRIPDRHSRRAAAIPDADQRVGDPSDHVRYPPRARPKPSCRRCDVCGVGGGPRT